MNQPRKAKSSPLTAQFVLDRDKGVEMLEKAFVDGGGVLRDAARILDVHEITLIRIIQREGLREWIDNVVLALRAGAPLPARPTVAGGVS